MGKKWDLSDFERGMEELRQFWRQKGVQPDTSKLYLIKWPVSVYVCGIGFCTKPIYNMVKAFIILISPIWPRSH